MYQFTIRSEKQTSASHQIGKNMNDPNGVSFVSQSKQNDCEQCENNTECEKK